MRETGKTEDPLLAFREEFPILASTSYLVSNSLGPMPRAIPFIRTALLAAFGPGRISIDGRARADERTGGPAFGGAR